jgi:Spy/CpxP family protein refolding chaperone
VSPWKVILATMVIFACGVFTGVIVTRTEPIALTPLAAPQQTPVTTNKMASLPFMQLQVQRPEFLKRLDRQLDLTPEQHDQIAKIMKESHERTTPLWEKIAPQMSDELKKVREEIRQVLTPEQRKKWGELMRRGRAQGSGNGRQPSQSPPPGTSTNSP